MWSLEQTIPEPDGSPQVMVDAYPEEPEARNIFSQAITVDTDSEGVPLHNSKSKKSKKTKEETAITVDEEEQNAEAKAAEEMRIAEEEAALDTHRRRMEDEGQQGLARIKAEWEERIARQRAEFEQKQAEEEAALDNHRRRMEDEGQQGLARIQAEWEEKRRREEKRLTRQREEFERKQAELEEEERKRQENADKLLQEEIGRRKRDAEERRKKELESLKQEMSKQEITDEEQAARSKQIVDRAKQDEEARAKADRAERDKQTEIFRLKMEKKIKQRAGGNNSSSPPATHPVELMREEKMPDPPISDPANPFPTDSTSLHFSPRLPTPQKVVSQDVSTHPTGTGDKYLMHEIRPEWLPESPRFHKAPILDRPGSLPQLSPRPEWLPQSPRSNKGAAFPPAPRMQATDDDATPDWIQQDIDPRTTRPNSQAQREIDELVESWVFPMSHTTEQPVSTTPQGTGDKYLMDETCPEWLQGIESPRPEWLFGEE